MNRWHMPGQAPEDDDEDLDTGPSKTQIKKHMLALTEMGEQVVNLPDSQLARVPMSERLEKAIRECRRITAHGGRKRQIQYIGKLMRELDDAEVDAIRAKLAAFSGESNAENVRFHALERWRDRLLADDAALQAYLDKYPEVEVQRLRQLIREARKDASAGKPPKHARELFKLLRETEEAANPVQPVAQDGAPNAPEADDA
ncbi:ribosome biogenesis factor YjgA [Piscinibacterium candidicorallinum]|uniref:Dual-action ribosomal maturation protein DarP n=1 Tax=Piscinibacterium candidicorallinum TaxID=1793872 RepID=A0ABV7H3W1_9BURK